MVSMLPQVLLKGDDEALPWPAAQSTFYVLAQNGLFLCRDHRFFRSCTKMAGWPSELGEQTPFLTPRFPRLPQRLFEQIVGFFARVAEQHGCEAGVLLYWNRRRSNVELVVPPQVATVTTGWKGQVHPIGLHYGIPPQLDDERFLFGDVHCHVQGFAFASGTDVHDEMHSPGLHIVVGQIHREPPDLHVEAVVDGTRFELEPEAVIEGYQKRDPEVPEEWLERVRVHQGTWRRPESPQ
jgi:hypothetical protein